MPDARRFYVRRVAWGVVQHHFHPNLTLRLDDTVVELSIYLNKCIAMNLPLLVELYLTAANNRTNLRCECPVSSGSGFAFSVEFASAYYRLLTYMTELRVP